MRNLGLALGEPGLRVVVIVQTFQLQLFKGGETGHEGDVGRRDVPGLGHVIAGSGHVVDPLQNLLQFGHFLLGEGFRAGENHRELNETREDI